MRIIVTGGGGFIGRHLVKSFLLNNNEVTIFENFSNSSKNDIDELLKNGVNLIRGNLTNYNLLKKSFRNMDHVIHLAANIDIAKSLVAPQKSNLVNVLGTINLLKASHENGIFGIIGASSAAVYGDPLKLPVNEKTIPNPVSPYGADKLSMENYFRAFANAFEMNCVSLRFFNVYGNGQSNSYAGVITKFIERLDSGKSLEVYGDGKNTRDYIYIDDLIHGIHKSLKKIKNKRGSVYNIASGKSYSVLDLAKILNSLYSKNSKIVYKPFRKGDLRHSKASILLSKKELNFKPKYNLKEGLKKMLSERN